MYDKLLKPRQSFRMTLYYGEENVVQIWKRVCRRPWMAKQRLARRRYDSLLFFHSLLKARQIARSRRKGGRDNIKMELQEWWGDMDWIDVAHDRDRWQAVVNAVMNFRVPWNTGTYRTSWETVGFSGRTLLHGVTFFRPSRKWSSFCGVWTHF